MPGPEADGTPAPKPARAARATLFTFVARASRSASRLLAFLVVARAFAVEETGIFAYLVVLGSLAGSVADLGLSEYVVRERGSPRLLRATALVRLATLTPAVLAAWLVAWISGGGDLPAAALGSLAFGCCGTAVDYLMAERRAHARYDLEMIEGAVVGLGPLVPATVLAALGGSFDEFQVVLGSAAFVLVAARLGWRLVRGDGRAPIASTVWAGRWFLGRSLVAWAVSEAPVLYVQRLGSAGDVAIFTAALRPVALLPHPFLALSNAFMPALAHDRVASRERFLATVRRLNLIVLAFLPAALGGCLVFGHLLLRSFGAAYLEAWPTLVTLAIAFVVYLGPLSGFPLIAAHRERALVLTTLAALVAMLAGSLLLAPSFGRDGVAWSMLVGFALAKALHAALYRVEGLPLGGWRDVALVSGAALWLAGSLALPTAAELILLVAGGVASTLLTLRLLHSTILFEKPPHEG